VKSTIFGADGLLIIKFDEKTQFNGKKIIDKCILGWEPLFVKCTVPDKVTSVVMILRGKTYLYSAGLFQIPSLKVFTLDDYKPDTSLIKKSELRVLSLKNITVR
jgi:hypothetical protein